MKKKMLSLLLAGSMAVGMLAGCGNTDEANSKGTSEVKETTETKESVATETSKVEEVKEDPTTVKWIIRCNPQEDDAKVLEEVNKLLVERYNLILELEAVSSAEYNDRMNLIITSGEDYDLCYTANYTNKFADNVAREAFLPLNDLLETEAAELLMSVYPEGIAGVATVDGVQYAVPNYQLMYSQFGAYIQKDLAEKYKLDVDSVKDIEDLIPFFEQIRDNEKDIWPLCEGASFSQLCFNDNAATYAGYNEAYISLVDGDYKVYTREELPDKVDAYRKVNEFYHNGFLRSDLATVVDNSSDLTAGRYACLINTAKPGGETDVSTKYGEEYIQIPLGIPYMSAEAGATTMTAINVNSKNPEAAIKLLGVMWTDPEIFNMLLFGIEGEHYKKVSENRVELIADSGYNRSTYGWMFGNQFNAWLVPGQADDVWEVTEAMNDEARECILSGFVFNKEPVSTEVAQISSVGKEYAKSLWYCDAEDFDALMKEMDDKLENAGLPAVVAELEKQIAEWRAANGK